MSINVYNKSEIIGNERNKITINQMLEVDYEEKKILKLKGKLIIARNIVEICRRNKWVKMKYRKNGKMSTLRKKLQKNYYS